MTNQKVKEESVFDIRLIKVSNKDKFIIQNITGKTLDELPLEYVVLDKPKIYLNSNANKRNLILEMNKNYIYFNIGDTLNLQKITLLISIMKNSNKVLKDIYTNQDILDLSNYIYDIITEKE